MLRRWTVLALVFASLLSSQAFLTHPPPDLRRGPSHPSAVASPEQVALTSARDGYVSPPPANAN